MRLTGMLMNKKNSLCILIAEADPVNRKVTSLMLKRLGCQLPYPKG